MAEWRNGNMAEWQNEEVAAWGHRREYFEDVNTTKDTFESTLWRYIRDFARLAKDRSAWQNASRIRDLHTSTGTCTNVSSFTCVCACIQVDANIRTYEHTNIRTYVDTNTQRRAHFWYICV